MPNYNWKKGIFSSTYRLREGDQELGTLTEKAFSSTSIGKIGDRTYRFKCRGMFNTRAEIIDEETDEVIGKIKFNTWRSKAQVELGDTQLEWKYRNWMQTKWKLSGDEGIRLDYAAKMVGGQIESSTKDHLIILTGLYITNYYYQASAFIVAIMVPILANG